MSQKTRNEYQFSPFKAWLHEKGLASIIAAISGELLGTFILVFFGCGCVAVAVLLGSFSGLFQIAMIWSIGVAIAIYATRHMSCAHLNPAVTLAMVIAGRMKKEMLPIYWMSQFIGAFLAAAVLYVIFNTTITEYESVNGIIRGTEASIRTAMMFGEFYPNPGISLPVEISASLACLIEGIGTFVLVMTIFLLTEDCNCGKPNSSSTPIIIGLTVGVIICLLAPLTQAGLNPARDFGPRIFAYLAGWRQAAMPDQGIGFFTVYILGPLCGASVAAILFSKIIKPIMNYCKTTLNQNNVDEMVLTDAVVE